MNKEVCKSLLLSRKKELIVASFISMVINFFATGGFKIFNVASKVKGKGKIEEITLAIDSVLSLNVIGSFLLILFIVSVTIVLFNNKDNERKQLINLGRWENELFISKYLMIFIISFIGILPNALIRLIFIGGYIRILRYFFVILLVNLLFFTFFMLFQMLIRNNVTAVIIALYIPCSLFFILGSFWLLFSNYFWIITDTIGKVIDSTILNVISHFSTNGISVQGFTSKYTLLIILLVLMTIGIIYLSYLVYLRIIDSEEAFYFEFIKKVVYYVNAYNISFILFTGLFEVIIFIFMNVNTGREFIKFILNLISIGAIPVLYSIQESKEVRKSIFKFLSHDNIEGGSNASSWKRA